MTTQRIDDAGCGGEAAGRKGRNTCTYSGRPFWPLDPRVEDVRVEDIAHSLSMICRFNGHVRAFYSVAQHSVLVSYATPPEFALEGLLHDASEAYVGDMVKPLKVDMEAYREAEARVDAVVREKFGLPATMSKEVKEADFRLFVTEKRDLISPGQGVDWGDESGWPEPLPERIRPLTPDGAKRMFLWRYFALGGEARVGREEGAE